MLLTKGVRLRTGQAYGTYWNAMGRALAYWETLQTDPGSVFDREVQIEAGVAPQVTWGTNPEMVTDVTGRPRSDVGKTGTKSRMTRALEYMGLYAN